MKKLIRTSLKLLSISALLLTGAVATATAQGAKLQLDQLDVLANKASNTVDVRLDERLLQMATKLFNEKDDPDIKEMLKGVKGIYVKVFEFEKEGEYSQADVESVMSQLRGSGWDKIVSVKSRKENENVEVYLNTTGDQVNGLAVLTIEPKELTVINLVGPIDLDKLSQLEGKFNIPELDIEKDKSKKKP